MIRIEKNNQNNVIVTGATGFIGRHLVKNLIDSKYDVIALVRDFDKAQKISHLKGAEIITFDITNKVLNFDIYKDTTLIHCAWDSVDDVLSLNHLEAYKDHYEILSNFIKFGIKKIIVTGTLSEYGMQYGPISPDAITVPNTPYALAKDRLHKALRQFQNQAEFGLIWARLFYSFGEGQNNKCLIPQFDLALERNDEFFNMSMGEQLLDYLPVEEVSKKILLLMETENNGVFNVCSGKPISLRRLLESRMASKGKYIKLNLGYYEYRKHDSIAIWGLDK